MKLKVCGMKYEENIRQVAELKPDYMGFIFYSKSKRFVGADFKFPSLPASIKKVGVFVNEAEDMVRQKTAEHKLDFAQLHGDENPEYCQSLNKYVKIIKAFGMDDHFDFGLLKAYKTSCAFFLFDTKSKEYGGTGKTFNWKILRNYDNEIPFFLSGGIDENSLDELKNHRGMNIHALDINSKFETEPGKKDFEKIKQFKLRITNETNFE